ncbi:1-deoxy-D-xylulose 5-phosphate reductoisomerase [Chlamydiales bacterium STE3]|nr:1-deoxy-D-xylulose 5-phosphate reductoisomerase [Chlamydiales bacterium STE3]
MRYLAILGSTGSIGKNALAAAKHLGEEVVQVVALAANSNIDLLEQQAKEFNPQIVAVYDLEKARELQKRIPHILVIGGMEGLEAVAVCEKANLVISAISGAIGLTPTIAAIKAKKNIGFANKEVLVSGGEIVMALVRQYGVEFIPIDSELTAIFQCLKGESEKSVQRIIITASGGPFRHYTSQQLENVTIANALNHPNYKMGPKVTVDSSTLMNKGIEMIEAHWLFDVPVDQIEVVVHPQQIIHGMVEFSDNSLLAHLSDPDMIIPIQYAITYPKRMSGSLPPFDFFKNNTLQFAKPDMQNFRCLQLAYDAARCGKSLPCYMNAANEILVHRFLNQEVSWKDIAYNLEHLMAKHKPLSINSLQDVFEVDSMAREEAKRHILKTFSAR